MGQVTASNQAVAYAPLWKRMGYTGSEDSEGFGPYFGTITGANKGEVWFITSEQVTAALGRDAAVHASIMKQCNLAAGDFIAFNAQQAPSGKIWMSAPCWKCCSEDENLLHESVSNWLEQQGSTHDVEPVHSNGPPRKMLKPTITVHAE